MKRLILISLSLLLLSLSPLMAKPTVLHLLVDHGVPLSLKAPALSVFVANPDIADVQVLSPSRVMLFGKRTGETTFMATGDQGSVLAQHTLVVSQDLSGLREELRTTLPGNDIKAKAVPGGIILTGTARDAVSVADAYKIAMRYISSGGDIINRVQVTGSNQIQIRVRFAEVQRNVDHSLGFNWQTLLSAGSNMTIGLATGSSVKTGTSTFDALTTSTLFPRPNNTSLGMKNSILGLSARMGDLTVDGMIDAMAQEGFLTILAEPNLTAMSGETANFLAGGQFPIPVPQGNDTISVQFQPYGISLAFTPTVLSGDRISLHVRPEVSELTNVGALVLDNLTVPALTTRKAETTVEVASGESFAIAGLMNNSQSQTVNKFPMLGDLPILGALFRSDHFVNGQTELVIIITPYIVRPSKAPLALPTDGFSPPSESERLLDFRNSSSDPNARPMSGNPVAVLDVEAPAAAPVVPVSSEVSVKTEPVGAPAPKKEPAAKPEPPQASLAAAATKPPVQEPPAAAASPQTEKPKAASAPPVTSASVKAPAPKLLILYKPRDADKRSGALLVE